MIWQILNDHSFKKWISKGNIQDTSYKIIGQWKADLGIPGETGKYLERPRQNFVEQRYFLAVVGIMENCWQWKKGYSQFCCITLFERVKVFQHQWYIRKHFEDIWISYLPLYNLNTENCIKLKMTVIRIYKTHKYTHPQQLQGTLLSSLHKFPSNFK